MKIVHKKRILIHFCRDMNWYSFLFLPNIFLPQMPDSRHRMIEQHSRSCPSHHYSHSFPHFRLIAMHGTNPTSWFPVSERTTWKPCLRILQQFPALRAQCSVPLFLPAVEANHLFYGLLFLFDAGVFHISSKCFNRERIAPFPRSKISDSSAIVFPWLYNVVK